MVEIKRNTTGLMDVLFETLEKLIGGKITPQDTTARVAVSRAIVDTKRLEIQTAKFVSENRGKEAEGVSLGS